MIALVRVAGFLAGGLALGGRGERGDAGRSGILSSGSFFGLELLLLREEVSPLLSSSSLSMSVSAAPALEDLPAAVLSATEPRAPTKLDASCSTASPSNVSAAPVRLCLLPKWPAMGTLAWPVLASIAASGAAGNRIVLARGERINTRSNTRKVGTGGRGPRCNIDNHESGSAFGLGPRADTSDVLDKRDDADDDVDVDAFKRRLELVGLELLLVADIHVKVAVRVVFERLDSVGLLVEATHEQPERFVLHAVQHGDGHVGFLTPTQIVELGLDGARSGSPGAGAGTSF